MEAITVNSRTRKYAILGDPIGHSLSPVIMNGMFRRLGMDRIFLAFRVNLESFGRVFPVLRELELSGYVMTMPVKEAAAGFMDRLEDEAALTGAVNCAVERDGELIGHNTDSVGFWTAVMEESSGTPPKKVFIMGTGGFAKAAAAQAALQGVKEFVVANMAGERERIDAFTHFFERLDDARPGVRLRLLDWKPETWPDELGDADLIVNATPNGLAGKGDLHAIFPFGPVKRDALFFDAVYNPLETAFLARAKAEGHRVIDGLDLLAHQGVRSFRLWTGAAVEPAVMRRDALRFLERLHMDDA